MKSLGRLLLVLLILCGALFTTTVAVDAQGRSEDAL